MLREWFYKVFGIEPSVDIDGFRELLQEHNSLKKSALDETLEYKRIEDAWKPYQQGIEKGQNSVVVSRLNEKYLDTRKSFEKSISNLFQKQKDCQKDIIRQIKKSAELLPLLFVDDFLTENKYNRLVCDLVKGHKEGTVPDKTLKEIIKYQKKFMVDGEPVYLKDNRNQYADVIIIDDENRILFTIRNKNDDFGPGAYCLPGGHIEDGETPRQAAKRELFEETGIELDLEELVPCGEYIDNKSHIFYFCANSNVEPVVLEEKEQVQYEKVPFDGVDQKPLLLNLQHNLEHLIAIPKTLMNSIADNAQILYFDGKTFKKREDKIPFVKSESNYAILTEKGEIFVYGQGEAFEKSRTSSSS